ncbi:hypothetical protein SNE40_009921 [Patella caerulea]|uniref:Uncharacterized protein n=1 Tax=Patella caerulea TaxID=87958 RepID=A0AAN8JZY1_PATCE
MAENLDPILASFWEGFPCPPPWRSGILQHLNFSGCLGSSVGNRIRSLMLKRCSGTGFKEISEIIMEDNSTYINEIPEHVFVMDACALNCRLLIVSVCVVFLVGMLAGIIYLLYRNHFHKPSNGVPRSAQPSRHDVSKAFNSCHYASAPVIGRLDETSFCHGKEMCRNRPRNGVMGNRYDKLRFPSDKRSQIYPGMRDSRLPNYENDLETSNDYESIDDLDKCDSKNSSPMKFGCHYQFGNGETILSISSDLDTDDNLCQVSTDNLNDEESFSSVACNEAFEPENSGDDISCDYLADLKLDLNMCTTSRPVNYVPTFSTFNKEVSYT